MGASQGRAVAAAVASPAAGGLALRISPAFARANCKDAPRHLPRASPIQMATPACLALMCRYPGAGENVSLRSSSHLSQAFAEVVHEEQLQAALKRIR